MDKFLIKGIFRDRHRWLFPLLIVGVGVMIMVFSLSFMKGYENSFIRQNSRFDTGHMKVVSRAYAEMLQQKPFDLALIDIEDDLEIWKAQYPQLEWAERISFGALLDVPDDMGETRAQGEVVGFAIDIFGNPQEVQRMNLQKAIIKGRMPQQPGEVLLSNVAFEKLDLKLDDQITLIGATVFGSMSMQNFKVVGAVEFGVFSLDRGAVVADLSDIQTMLDLEGGASEILAFFKDAEFDAKVARRIASDFNQKYSDEDDEFSPQMLSMMEQNNMGYLLGIFSQTMYWTGVVFVFILGIVLWNSGLMNGIRRYGEFGIRLAIGESKAHVYWSLLYEAFVLGLVGSIIGLGLGLVIDLIIGTNGMDVTAYTRSSTMMFENIIYTDVTWGVIIASFVPGVLSTLFGAALAGIAIFKRQTSQLFKELET